MTKREQLMNLLRDIKSHWVGLKVERHRKRRRRNGTNGGRS